MGVGGGGLTNVSDNIVRPKVPRNDDDDVMLVFVLIAGIASSTESFFAAAGISLIL